MSPEELSGKFLIGELFRREATEYTKAYDKVIGIARSGGTRDDAGIALAGTVSGIVSEVRRTLPEDRGRYCPCKAGTL